MPKMKYSSLMFVSRSDAKYEEYRTLLGFNLAISRISMDEPQNIFLEDLVKSKIEQVRSKLPSHVPFFVDHTSLTIEAWNNLPGGLISQFMATVGNNGICKMMSAYKKPSERIATASVLIGYFDQDSSIHHFRGDVKGSIAPEPRGVHNFGWDAIFIPQGSAKTYAEMSSKEKNQNSMRKLAIDLFRGFLAERFEL